MKFDPIDNTVTGFELFCSYRMPKYGYMFKCAGCKKQSYTEHQNVTENKLAKRLGLICIQSVWRSDGIPEIISRKSCFEKNQQTIKKHGKLPRGQRVKNM